MKTLLIERPGHLSKMAHSIIWDAGGYDLRDAPKQVLEDTLKVCNAIGSGATAVSNYLVASQLLSGAVVVVDERVSRELEVSTVVCSLENLAWPADCMEMRFRDPNLPSIIIMPDIVKNTVIKNEKGGVAVAFAASNKDGSMLTLALPEEMWKGYVEGQLAPNMDKIIREDLTMDDYEAEAMKYLATLAIKVIAYSSVPRHAPVPVKTRAELKEAGFHPKHLKETLLPTQNAMLVRYLPRVEREPQTREEEAERVKRRFLGRAGHIHYYKSDYFKNMKGKWRWMPPIPPPEGIKVIYKVRHV